MVSDENQVIYTFDSSSSNFMSNLFIQDFNPTIYYLNENFRSAKQIVKFSNMFTGNTENLEKYVYNGELSATVYADEISEAQAVREMIKALMADGHKDIENDLGYHNFAVIARNKYIFSQIENEFSKNEIPFFYNKYPSGIACESDFMEAFELILRLLMNPLDVYHRQLLSKLVLKELSQDLSCNDIKTHIEKLVIDTSFEWLKYAFKPLTTTDSFNFGKALSELKDNIPDRLSDDDKYLLVNDIGEWEKHWKKYQSQIPSQKRSLISFRNLISLGKTLDIDAEAGVALLTGPMSKSLEFEVVFIIGLSEGTFPDYRAVRRGGEHIEQEKNNMFMAVSRAKRLCYLSYPKEKLMPWGDIKRQNPSRFIGLALQAQE